jgi:hypothetical protein
MERFAVYLTPRDAHENRLCSGLLSAWLLQTMLLAVRRYDADWIRAFAHQQGPRTKHSLKRIGRRIRLGRSARRLFVVLVWGRPEGVLRRWLVNPSLCDEPHDCLSYARVR